MPHKCIFWETVDFFLNLNNMYIVSDKKRLTLRNYSIPVLFSPTARDPDCQALHVAIPETVHVIIKTL